MQRTGLALGSHIVQAKLGPLGLKQNTLCMPLRDKNCGSDKHNGKAKGGTSVLGGMHTSCECVIHASASTPLYIDTGWTHFKKWVFCFLFCAAAACNYFSQNGPPRHHISRKTLITASSPKNYCCRYKKRQILLFLFRRARRCSVDNFRCEKRI